MGNYTLNFAGNLTTYLVLPLELIKTHLTLLLNLNKLPLFNDLTVNYFFTKNLSQSINGPLNLDTNLTSLKTSAQGNKFSDDLLINQTESQHFFRYQKTLNPIFKYDYKLGNYITKNDLTMFPFLFTTFSEQTGGIRKSAWFFSDKFLELFETNVSTYLNTYTGTSSKDSSVNNVYILNNYGFYNLFFTLSNYNGLVNTR